MDVLKINKWHNMISLKLMINATFVSLLGLNEMKGIDHVLSLSN